MEYEDNTLNYYQIKSPWQGELKYSLRLWDIWIICCPICLLRHPCQGTQYCKVMEMAGKKTLPRVSPWINLLCCWEHQAPSLLGIISWNLQWDISPGSETFHPWVKGNYSISSGILLSCCKLDLLKHMAPRFEHIVLTEGRKWGSWSSISHPQSTSSRLNVLPTQAVCMVCTSRPAS